jgi:hypothetical protein
MPTAKKETIGVEPPKGVLRADIRALMPDVNDPVVRARLKASIAALDPEDEADAMRWIEAVSMFDNEDRDLE